MNKRLATTCILASLILFASATAAQEQSTFMQTAMGAYNSSLVKGAFVIGTLGYIGWQWKRANQMQQEITSLRPLKAVVKAQDKLLVDLEKLANKSIKAKDTYIATLQGELNHEKTQNTELLLDKISLRNARDKFSHKATQLQEKLTVTNNTNTQLKEKIKTLENQITILNTPLTALSSNYVGEYRNNISSTPLGRPSLSPQKQTPTTASVLGTPIAAFFTNRPSDAAVRQYLGLDSTNAN